MMDLPFAGPRAPGPGLHSGGPHANQHMNGNFNGVDQSRPMGGPAQNGFDQSQRPLDQQFAGLNMNGVQRNGNFNHNMAQQKDLGPKFEGYRIVPGKSTLSSSSSKTKKGSNTSNSSDWTAATIRQLECDADDLKSIIETMKPKGNSLEQQDLLKRESQRAKVDQVVSDRRKREMNPRLTWYLAAVQLKHGKRTSTRKDPELKEIRVVLKRALVDASAAAAAQAKHAAFNFNSGPASNADFVNRQKGPSVNDHHHDGLKGPMSTMGGAGMFDAFNDNMGMPPRPQPANNINGPMGPPPPPLNGGGGIPMRPMNNNNGGPPPMRPMHNDLPPLNGPPPMHGPPPMNGPPRPPMTMNGPGAGRGAGMGIPPPPQQRPIIIDPPRHAPLNRPMSPIRDASPRRHRSPIQLPPLPPPTGRSRRHARSPSTDRSLSGDEVFSTSSNRSYASPISSPRSSVASASLRHAKAYHRHGSSSASTSGRRSTRPHRSHSGYSESDRYTDDDDYFSSSDYASERSRGGLAPRHERRRHTDRRHADRREYSRSGGGRREREARYRDDGLRRRESRRDARGEGVLAY